MGILEFYPISFEDDSTKLPSAPPPARRRRLKRPPAAHTAAPIPPVSASAHALWAEDNATCMQALLDAGQAGTVDLIYLDPPFSTGDRFGMAGAHGVVGSYTDAWPTIDAYLAFLTPRLTQMHRLLADHGALFLHCDWRTSAHLRLRLEALFGPANFRNEIIWRRGDNRGRKSCARHLGRTTDSILYFVKNAASPALRFHPPVQLRKHRLRSDGRAPAGFFRDTDGRYFKTAPRGDYTDASIARLRTENRVYETRSGRLRIKYFLECTDGAILEPLPVDTLWTDLPDAMHLPASERFGYPTQKPLGLLKRIVACASNPGDRVFDPFCGSGTTLVAAAALDRQYWGCDVSPAAVNLALTRLCLSAKSPAAAAPAALDRRGNNPVVGEIPPSACGLAWQTTRNRRLPKLVAMTTPLSQSGASTGTARGVRLRADAAGRQPPSPVHAPEQALLVELHAPTGQVVERWALEQLPSAHGFEIALAEETNPGYYFSVIDRLGRRYRLAFP